MATYRVNVGNRDYVVDVSENQVSVDGMPIQASLTALNNGGLVLLRRDNHARELHIRPQGNHAYAVMVNGRHVVAQVEKGNGKVRKPSELSGGGTIKAPMPGMVVDVLVKEGQVVDSGDPLVVLESMKMQMQLRSPLAGCVSKILAQTLAHVDKGALLVQVTAE